MAAGGSTQHSLRKAIGALKDSTRVGLVKVNSDNKRLDIAIVKATNHDEVLPKEKHVRTIIDAVSASRPRDDVAYCIQGLAKRLAKTHTWTVALKTLIVVHRALRESDPIFHEELISYSRGRGLMLNLSRFRDNSTPQAWEYSAWVRRYALYLEERLECFRTLKYDVLKDQSRKRELNIPEFLEQLPALQQLLYHLLACKPEGAAVYNSLIHYALSVVAGESVRIYVAITDMILKLVDKYFEMKRHDAIRALQIYRKAGNQGESLSELFEICGGLTFGRGQKYIKIEQPPAAFLASMEEYVKEAPQALMPQYMAINDSQPVASEEITTIEADLLNDHKEDVKEKSEPSVTSSEPPKSDQIESTAAPLVTDLLCLDEPTQEASELDEKNSLALAIVTTENPSNTVSGLSSASQTTNWELALVSAPSSNGAAVAESKLAGGLDKLTLDSLYDNAVARSNQDGTYHMGQVAPYPFEATYCNQDPFYASNNIAPPTNVQMASMAQQQQMLFMQQQQQQQQIPIVQDSTNPFGDPSVPCQTLQNSYPSLI